MANKQTGLITLCVIPSQRILQISVWLLMREDYMEKYAYDFINLKDSFLQNHNAKNLTEF